MSLEQDLINLKAKSEKLNSLRIETSTKIKGLEAERDKLLEECYELGIDPTLIEQVLKKEESALKENVRLLDEQLDSIFSEISKV